MKLDGRRESQNVDDRRGKRTATKASMGIGGVVIAALLTWILGGDPSSVLKMAQTNNITTEDVEYVPTAEEEALATFAKQILAGTEDVWTAEFKKIEQKQEVVNNVQIKQLF